MTNQIESAQLKRTESSQNLMQERYCDKVDYEIILAADTVMEEVVKKVLRQNSMNNKPTLFIP
jgi:hypothetical protein